MNRLSQRDGYTGRLILAESAEEIRIVGRILSCWIAHDAIVRGETMSWEASCQPNYFTPKELV
ncbi:hypothetical protein SBV1_2320011 [Verrucomicrobia bacterium]|nr:hypothetical protein SBV1_2320011 [Verrucomicrobiota bacterium]